MTTKDTQRWHPAQIELVQRFINAAQRAVDGDRFDAKQYDKAKDSLIRARVVLGVLPQTITGLVMCSALVDIPSTNHEDAHRAALAEAIYRAEPNTSERHAVYSAHYHRLCREHKLAMYDPEFNYVKVL